MSHSDNWLLHDHRNYEEMLLEFKGVAREQDWQNADKKFHDLVALLKGHFLMEEEVLFPAYEELVRAPEGPTESLRADHVRIRNELRRLGGALGARDPARVSESLRSLDAVMDRHHEKEEEIFLPMAGHALLQSRDQVMERLKRFDWKYAMKSWRL